MCDAISFNVERALVSLNEIIVIEQMLREILPLGTVDSFKCHNLKLLNVNLIRFTFKTYFVFYGYSPPKYSLNCLLSASDNSTPNAEEIFVSRSLSSLTVRKQSANV